MSRLRFVEENTVDAAEARVQRVNLDRREAGALPERRFSDVGNTVGDIHTGQAGAIGERIALDAGDAVGDTNAGQVAALVERTVPEAGNSVAVGISAVPDAGNSVGYAISARYALPIYSMHRLRFVEENSVDAAEAPVRRVNVDRRQMYGIRT